MKSTVLAEELLLQDKPFAEAFTSAQSEDVMVLGSCSGLRGNARALLGAMKLPFAFCRAARLKGRVASLLAFKDDKAEAYAVNLHTRFFRQTLPESQISSAIESPQQVHILRRFMVKT